MSINLYEVKEYIASKGFNILARFKEPNGDIRNVSWYSDEKIKKMSDDIMKKYRFVGYEYSSDGWRKYNIYTGFEFFSRGNIHGIELKFIKKVMLLIY